MAYKQNAPPTPFGFVGAKGYHTDYQDSNLALLGNRYYDAGIGRFLSPDPSGSGDNWYAYCDNDPTGEIDPEGLLGVATPTSHEDQFSRYSQAIEADGGNSKTYEVDAVFRYAGGSHAGQEVPGTRYEEYEYTVYFGAGDFQLVNINKPYPKIRTSWIDKLQKLLSILPIPFPEPKPSTDEAAADLGHTQRVPANKLPFNSHGQPGYFNSKTKSYITRDIDGHNTTDGWKLYKQQSGAWRRQGTYDADLNRIKD